MRECQSAESARAARATRGCRRAAIILFTAMATAGAASPRSAPSGGSEVACAVVMPGAVLDQGAFVLIGAPAVGQAQRGRFGAAVGPLACFEVGLTGPVLGDVNGDGRVNGADLGTLLGQWGPCEGCPADLDGNGAVDGSDLGTLLGAWTG